MADEVFIKMYKEAYMEEAVKMLNIADQPEKIASIKKLVDDRFLDTDIRIFNNEMYEDIFISTAEFWFNRKDYVLNENGILFDTTGRHESITSALIADKIDFRQVLKKGKKKAAEVNDVITERKFAKMEALAKLEINGFYGWKHAISVR